MTTDIKRKSGFYLLPLAVGAVLTAITLIFPQTGFMEWFSLIPVMTALYCLSDRSDFRLWRAYRYGFFTLFCYYFVLYHWFIRLYPLDFVGMDNTSSLVVIIAGWLGLTLLQALPGGLIFLLYAWMNRTGIFRRAPLLRPFAVAALWTVFEWSSTLGWTGVPWGRLCLGQAMYLPVLQSASLFGSYLISFLILLVNGLLAYGILYRARATICCVTAAALFGGNLLFGAVRLAQPTEEPTVTAAVIQGNINSHDKWDGNSYELMRTTYADYTRLAANAGAKLIIWPETAFPYVLNQSTSLQKFVSELARECNVTLIIGALYDDADGNEYNALFQIDPDGTIRQNYYAKQHLVPFGEYVPMREVFMTLIPPLAELSALDDDLTPGMDSALFFTDYGKIGSLICFDSIYEQLTLNSVRDGAELMIISSNDSWFYDSAAVYMHESQARLRAIESGRFLLRAANTGISSIIDTRGHHLSWIDPLVGGYAIADVRAEQGRTLYTRVGNLLVYLCILFAATILVVGLLTGKPKAKTDCMRRFYGIAKEKGRG